MELKIKNPTLPQAVEFNYEELKKAITEKTEIYKTMVYTAEQLPAAKKDLANLRALKKAINDERIRLEKEYMQPFNEFKRKTYELIGIIESPIALIDKQVKEYGEQKKTDKLEAVKKLWKECSEFLKVPEWVTFEKVLNPKWLNASTKETAIKNDMDYIASKIVTDLETLKNMPDFAFEATEVYKHTLDINKAIQEGQKLSEMQKRKAEAEATATSQKESPQPKTAEDEHSEETNRQWVKFKAFLTVEEAKELSKFLKDRNIEFKAVLN